MDRLVCGDVGFGKTEIAMRAAFLAVEAGKQVVMSGTNDTCWLVSITKLLLIASAKYPVLIKSISRFQSIKRTKTN